MVLGKQNIVDAFVTLIPDGPNGFVQRGEDEGVLEDDPAEMIDKTKVKV